MTGDDVRVRIIRGSRELQMILQELKDRGIKPKVLPGADETFTVIYEDVKILNEG